MYLNKSIFILVLINTFIYILACNNTLSIKQRIVQYRSTRVKTDDFYTNSIRLALKQQNGTLSLNGSRSWNNNILSLIMTKQINWYHNKERNNIHNLGTHFVNNNCTRGVFMLLSSLFYTRGMKFWYHVYILHYCILNIHQTDNSRIRGFESDDLK